MNLIAATGVTLLGTAAGCAVRYVRDEASNWYGSATVALAGAGMYMATGSSLMGLLAGPLTGVLLVFLRR